MDIFRESKQKNRKRQRVGRGGKRGTTAGRGTKGQKSRSGRRIRPAERDYIIRTPKMRGVKNPSLKPKFRVLNVRNLEQSSNTVFDRKDLGPIKVLGDGNLTKAVTLRGLMVSKTAKEKIEKAGGQVL